MSANTTDDVPNEELADLGQGYEVGQPPPMAAGPGHFDTFETDFFEQGDDGASMQVEVESFDDLDGVGKKSHALLSRHTLVILAASMAALGCAALWHSNARPSPPVVEAKSEAVPAVAPEPVEAETPPPRATASAEARPPTVEGPNQPLLAPARANAHAEPAGTDNPQEECRKAIHGKRSKDILAVCPAAVSDDSNHADIPLALARIEFDRGRSAQAYAWARRAIAANPSAADAYVFLGGAEQNAGHGNAAKQAYQHYLRLAPTGRYAADLRAIVHSL
jgi:hypothetical protein